MPQEDLINFIKERLAEGFDEKSIREALAETGHSQEEIEKAFQAILKEKEIPKEFPSEPEIPKKEEVLPYQLREREIPPFAPLKISTRKKFLLPLIILVVLIFIGGASALLYDKLAKPDPASMLPQETAFYARVKINPEDKQVKNLKENLAKFPYYEKLSEKISEEFEKMKKENPPLRNLDFTISDELILAWISPFDLEMKEFSLILILPDPDLKKLEKLAKDVQSEIEKSKDWKLETETYLGREIYKAVPTQESIYKPLPGEPKLEPSTTFTNGHFVLATKPGDIKKIIDVAEDQKITKILKKDKIKNINSGLAYRKIKKYLPKDYLALFYGEFNFAKILKTAEMTETVKETEKILPPLLASLKAALNLPFFKGKEIEEPEKIAFASVIIAEKNELRTESYSLDIREDAFEPSSFSFQESLSQFIPEKINNRDIFFYGEGRDLKGQLEFFEKETLKSATPEGKKQYEEALNSFNQALGLDLKGDILSWMDKNFAIISASEAGGREIPFLAFVFDIANEREVKEKLLKISVQPLPFVPLGAPYPPEAPLPRETISFTKENIEGFEIYSLLIFGEFGLNFTTKDGKVVFTLTKEGLVNFLKSLGNKKLKDSKLFAEQLREIPQEITSISYLYPYGLLGPIKWATTYLIGFIPLRLGVALEELETQPEFKELEASISEFLDRGIAPYLKVLKSSGSYSYSPERGLIVNKGRLIILELPSEEKKATEEFWANIGKWVEEKFGPLFSPVYGPPLEPIY